MRYQHSRTSRGPGSVVKVRGLSLPLQSSGWIPPVRLLAAEEMDHVDSARAAPIVHVSRSLVVTPPGALKTPCVNQRVKWELS